MFTKRLCVCLQKSSDNQSHYDPLVTCDKAISCENIVNKKNGGGEAFEFREEKKTKTRRLENSKEMASVNEIPFATFQTRTGNTSAFIHFLNSDRNDKNLIVMGSAMLKVFGKMKPSIDCPRFGYFDFR